MVQPTLLQISATVDGSGRIVFTRDTVRYIHLHYKRPDEVKVGSQVWTDFSSPLPGWNGANLDLKKASIVKRQGRDVIALEHTADGFDLYFVDSPVGPGYYEVTVAIPPLR
jgi:hypothetical protein